MKKSVIIVAVLLFSTIGFAQKVKATKVPEMVSKALLLKYPNAKEIEWEKEDSNYEASFESNGTENSVLIAANGNIIETEVELAAEELPNSIRNYINSNYTNKKVKEAAKLISDKEIVTYKTEIQGKDLIFDANGKLLSVR